MRLRVCTLNVQNTECPPERQQLINQELRNLRPDLLSLQEVASADQLGELLSGTGLRGTFQADVLGYEMPFADRYGGTALATRDRHRVLEVLDQRSSDAPDVPWCTLAASVSLDGLGELLMIATTAAWRLDAELLGSARLWPWPTSMPVTDRSYRR